MKKDVLFVYKINSEYTQMYAENILLWRYEQILKNQYSFPLHDFYSFCGIVIKQNGIESLSENFRNTILINEELIPEVRFEVIRYKLNDDQEVNGDDLVFFKNVWAKKIAQRKKVIKKEVSKTNPNGKLLNNLSSQTSEHYDKLLELTSHFENTTLLDGFIPIVIKYDRVIHIFVKHVEETKFGDGQFKERTFFTYKPEEIWTLIKTIIKHESESIKDHFIENSVKYELGKDDMKDYYRGFVNPVILDEDKFILRIDKNGFIVQFHQFLD